MQWTLLSTVISTKIADFCPYLQIIHDVDILAREVCGDYLGLIVRLLSSCSAEVHDSVKESILQGGKSLSGMIPPVISTIIDLMAEKAAEVLILLKMHFSYIVFAWICPFQLSVDANFLVSFTCFTLMVVFGNNILVSGLAMILICYILLFMKPCRS